MLWSKLRSLLTEYVFFFPSSFSSFAPSLPQKKKNNNNKQFDALIERSLHLISRLRLGEIREVNSSDGTVTLRPDNVVDMDLFLNLCTFLDCLLPLRVDPMDRSRFSRWIPTLCETVVAVAMRPSCHNVSGFYRLLTIAMRNGDRDNFFRPGASTTVRCREILRPFLQGIQRRMYAHTDELLAACVEFVLSIPNPTIVDVGRQVPFLIRALELGLSHPPTAKCALTALEAWTSPLRPEFELHLGQVQDCVGVAGGNGLQKSCP